MKRKKRKLPLLAIGWVPWCSDSLYLHEIGAWLGGFRRTRRECNSYITGCAVASDSLVFPVRVYARGKRLKRVQP